MLEGTGWLMVVTLLPVHDQLRDHADGTGEIGEVWRGSHDFLMDFLHLLGGAIGIDMHGVLNLVVARIDPIVQTQETAQVERARRVDL